MKHYKRQYVSADNSADRFVILINFESHYSINAKTPLDVTPFDLLMSSCMFKLPAYSYAFIDIYRHVNSAGDVKFVFSYEVHLSTSSLNATPAQMDALAGITSNNREAIDALLSEIERFSGGIGDLGEESMCDGAICDSGQTGPFPCPNPATTHLDCTNNVLACIPNAIKPGGG